MRIELELGSSLQLVQRVLGINLVSLCEFFSNQPNVILIKFPGTYYEHLLATYDLLSKKFH